MASRTDEVFRILGISGSTQAREDPKAEQAEATSRQAEVENILSSVPAAQQEEQAGETTPPALRATSPDKGRLAGEATPQSAAPTAPLTQGSLAGDGGRGGGADTRADLQRQLNALDEAAAYVTTTEQSDAIEQQRRPIIEQLRQMDEEEGRTGVYTGGDRLKNLFSNARLATQQGLTKADHRIAQTADWLFGGIAKEGRALLNTTLQSINPNWGFENEDPLITQYNKRGEDVIAHNEAVAQKRIEEGRLSPTAWKYAPEVVAAIPDAVLAYLTAGASSGAQATSAGLEAASAAAQAGKAAQTIVPVANATKNMIKNPAWASAFAQTAGSSYEQALAEGATEEEANLYALLNGFANATIEVGGSDEALGGIQKLPQQLRDALEKGNNTAVMRWIKSTANEAGEEVAQGMAEKALRGIYTNDVPLYSATDENAVINPTRAKEEALGGFVVGGLLGGGQSLLQAAINENRQSARSAQTAGQEQPGAETQATETAVAEETPQSALQTAPLQGEPLSTQQESQAQAAETADRLPKAELYNMRAGKNGWDKTYGTAQEALGEAVQYVDAELWNAIGKEIDNAEGNKQGFTPMTSAMIAVQEEVRQEQITPMQGAQLLSEIYQQGGAEALKTIYNPRTGNLYDKYIGQAKQYVFQKAAETAQETQRATPQAETPPTAQNDVTDALNALNLFEEGNVSSADYDTQSRESLMFSEAPQEAVQNTDSFGAVTANDDFQNRDFNDVGNQKIKAYMYENPEVKPFFQFEAEAMLGDLKNSVKGERFYNSQLAYDSGYEDGWTGNKRLVSDDIAVLLDYGYTYKEIEKGLKAIIEDDGRENNACSKRIEFLLNDRLMDGYTDWQSNEFVPPNQEYRNMILEKQINAYSKEAFEEYLKNAERYASKEPKTNNSGQLNTQAETNTQGQGKSVQREGRPTEGADTVRGFSENVATDSAMETALREDIAKNPDLYKRLSNKDTLKKAQDIFSQGIDTARSELELAIGAAQSGQKLAPEMVPLSRMVANELTRRGDLEAARKIISDVAAELTSAGQLGQAGAILRNADPMTALNTLQKSIDQINAEMAKKFGKRNPWKAELTAEEIKQISETDFSQDGAYEAIQQQIAERLGREMPATLAEKLREIRKVGMLANPKTQLKNLLGNAPLAVERKAAERLSGGLQELAVKAGIMSKDEQTRTLRVSQQSKDLAKSVYDNNIDRINRKGNKGELRGILRDTRTYFNKGLLQKGIEKATGHQLNDAALDYVRRFTYERLEKGDAPFVKSAFIDSIAQYCEAQGIKSEADVTDTAISYAIDQAMAATFKDASALAKLLNGIKDNAGIAGQALDVLLPFTTTPINIAKEFGKYSPLGYLQLLNAKGKGSAEVIDIISRATTGSAVVAIGAILRSLGFITGAADDDKDKAAADKAAGISPYSVLGKYSYEWMQPTGSALAMGASIYDAAKDGSSLIETLSNGIISAGDAYLEQSFYKDIIDLFQGYGSPTENMIREVLTGTASQFIPTIVGATARTIDPTVRTSYSGGNIIDDILAQAKVKTPGMSKSAPASVNVRGEEIQRGNLVQRILDNFIFPWTTNRNGGEENAVDQAIDEVYEETGDKTIFRQVSPYKVDYGGETYKMTGEEREQFQKTQGKVHDDILQQIIDGTLWQKMDNDAKVKTMQFANEYALDAAKRELVESRGNEYSSDWDDEAELPDVGDYLAAKTTLKVAQDSKDYTLLDALVDTVTEQKKDVQEKLNKDFSMLDELIYGKQHGVDAKTIYVAKGNADVNGNGSVTQEELWNYLGLQKNMPTTTKSVLWDILTSGTTGYAEYAGKHK